MADLANRAATFMEHLCTCGEHGYSQAERWGDASRGCCEVSADGVTRQFNRGDRDCSSAVIDSWQEALRGTAWEGQLNGATYTGNMRDAFLGTGLFTWEPMSFTAQRGDVYLNTSDHTAMCVDDGSGPYGYDALAEFSISETGGIYGQSGDQTGSESSIHGYYDFPWDGILHYNGQGDGADYSEADSGTATPSTGTGARYRAYTKEDGWLDWMEGTYDTGGSGDDFAGIEGHWVYGFEASFLFKVVLMDGSETEWTTQWHEDQAMRGIKIEDTRYQVHTVGNGWLKVENGMTDDGAGDDTFAVDMVRVW